jgi:arsenate reductase (glutaredoxin)
MEYERVNYYEKPLTPTKLKQLLKKLRMRAADLLREKEPVYRELKLAEKKASMSEDALIDLMIKYPDLMQRPIIERGNRAVIGRPTENICELL